MKKKKSGVSIIVVLASMFLILAFLFSPAGKETERRLDEINEKPQQTIALNTVALNLPAVDDKGVGVVAKLKVQVIPGEGRVLTNVNNILFWVDTQYSIRTAEMVAQNITGMDLTKIDLIYTIDTNASIIEGQSAGAAMAIATVAAIENKTLPMNVMITGTVNPDGTIGPVGAILAKAKASKDSGAQVFLVPKGQGTQATYQPEKTCEQVGSLTFCKTEYKVDKVDISEDAGLEVSEVATIREALPYFIK